MEQQRKTYSLMIIFLLTITSIHDVSSNQNLYTVTTTININSTDVDGIVTDHSWLQPLNTTTSSYQDFTTYLPTSTSTQAEEILDSSETNALSRFARPFYHHNEHKEDDEESVEEPPDHVIPYSEHEEARDVPTQPKYVAPGVWAKPPPDKDVPLDFVPTKLHAQVRGSHTVKRLPQREAVENAETDEERRNALRLRAVVTNSKVNTVYTEEGYEDSAYDHAGHIRDADFHEGFARKLHDQKKKGQHFSSGNKNKGENENLVPDEFKEYEEDYEDHLQENRKFEEADDEDNLIGYGRSSWEGSEIDPKFVAENNIQQLEEDIEKEVEEAERSEKTYQNAQESKLRNDVKVDSSESEESHVEDNSKHENKSIKNKKKKKKKSKLQNGKSDNVSKKTKSRKSELKKKLKNPENYETTVLPHEQAGSIDVETPASPRGFVKNSPQRYSIDQTTLSYVAPFDEPTTASYSQLFWDYFKARQGPSTTESSALVSSPTTMNPIQEARTPLAVATIDGHGPYLLVTKEETVTSPPAFLGPRSFRPWNLFSDDEEFGPTSAKTHSRYLLGQSDGVGYVSNVMATSTVATFTSVPSLSPGGVEYSSSTAASSSTPLNFIPEMVTYFDNPFLGPVLDNSNVAATRNKQLKYKVLARAKPSPGKKSQKPELETKSEKKTVKPVTQSPPQEVSPSFSGEENKNRKIRDELSAKYNKMLNYIKSKQEAQSFPKEKKIFSAKDLTPRKPIQRVAYSIVLTDHPWMNRSSVSAESESSRERAGPKSEANWKSKSQLHHHSQPAKSPFRFDPFAHVQPIYNKNSFPTTKLLPPPLPLASTYANYRSSKQNEHSHLGGKPQQRRDNPFKYFPLNLEASWRARSRRKRSEGEFRDGGSNATDVDVKAAANNSVTNDNKSEQQDKSSFDMVIDRLEGKSSSRRVIDAPIDVPDALKLVFPARSRGDESGTKSRNKSGTAANGERKNAEDEGEIIIGTSKIDKKGSILIQSAKETRRISADVELAKKKRDVKSEAHLMKNLKTKINEKNHEELLNDSPKISGDVIDEEIDARFNEEDNETPPKIKKHGKVEAEVPSFDYIEELLEDDEKSLVKFSATTEAAIDLKKYPFYNNEDVPSASALKYVVDPRTIPRKTARGMEFYDSRNAYKQCDEVKPNLDKVLPEKEEPDPERGLQEDLPRLRGLGDKLDCFKAKYFDENPLDSPLFAEKLVEGPTPPTEINPTRFASKIMVLPEENDEYVVPQVSKKPERSSRQNWRNRNRPYEALESIRVNYKHDPQTGRGRNAYLHTVRGSRLTRNMMRRVKNRKSWPKISTTTPPSPKLYQTDSYQSQVYEDVMGNIRNMKSTYQVYEMTTLPPSTQILVTAGSENTLKVADDNTSEEKSTLKPDITDVIDVTNKTKLSEIKGLVPPPKYVIYRQNYRKHRPLAKSRVSFIRSPTLPRIIAHHHTIKIKKRSTDYTAKNSSESTMNENKTAAINGSMEVDAIGNDTLTVKLVEEKAANKTKVTSEPLDLEIEESRPIAIKVNDTKKRRNSTSSDLKNEPQKIVYTIRDRIRYSKPKWDTGRFGKFTTSSKTVDEDSRRKEPRYNLIERKRKPADDRQNNSIIMNSTESTLGIESAKSFIEDRESSTAEAYHAQESAVQQKVFHKENEYPEVEKAENVDAESEESFFKEDEEESTTNTYQVRENVNENVSTTTTRSTNPQSSREVLDLEKYLESDPPGYAEVFSEEATTPSSKYHSNMNDESEDSDEKPEEETDYPRNAANPWDNDSSEKIEEQVETPVTTKLFSEDDDSEESSSKEEEESNKDQTFFTYPRRMSLIENDKDDENSEKVTAYKDFPFSRYKSILKKESEENDPEEESEEKREDYVFPWHADKKNKKIKYKWLYNLDRYEYPWERRDRLAKERKKRKQSRATSFDDEDEEESIRYDIPVYPWEKYNVPSKNYRVNTRRDLSRRYVDDSKESTTEFVPLTKYSSRYSSNGTKPSKFSSAREISRSIKKFLDKDESKEATKEVESSPSFVRKSSSSDRGISRGMLVPEDITQPPRRRNARRKVDKNVANNSRFNSKKLGSEDVTHEEKEEEPGEYVNKSDLDDPEITSSQQSQSEIPPVTEQRKKRRRRILKNNFMTFHDNASAESVTKPTKKRRRKLQASTTTSATPSASIDFDLRESAFTPIQKKYSKKAEKTNRSDFSERAAAKISEADDFPIVTSTPKTRTIEHRSRVSKEKIVTKTTYPNNTGNFNFTKTNLTPNRKEPVKRMRRRKNNIKRDGNNEDSDNKKELIEQEDKEGNYEIKFNEDAIKKSVISDESQDKSGNNTFKHLGMKKDEVKKINDFGTYDEIVNDENNNDNSDFGISSEIYTIRNLMQNIPPNPEKKRANGRSDSESNRRTEDWKERNGKETEEGKKENMEQKRKLLLQTKFIKDPERRLYYYVERK